MLFARGLEVSGSKRVSKANLSWKTAKVSEVHQVDG